MPIRPVRPLPRPPSRIPKSSIPDPTQVRALELVAYHFGLIEKPEWMNAEYEATVRERFGRLRASALKSSADLEQVLAPEDQPSGLIPRSVAEAEMRALATSLSKLLDALSQELGPQTPPRSEGPQP